MLLNWCDNTAACTWINRNCKHSVIGQRLGRLVVGLLMSTKIGIQAEWVSTHLNVIADNISRLKDGNNGDFDCEKIEGNLPNTYSLPTIPAINYPSYNDLGRSTEQKLSRSINWERAQTQCSTIVHFLKLISRYDLGNRYLTDDVIVTDDILLRYVNHLLKGFTLQKIRIEVGTIKGYLGGE